MEHYKGLSGYALLYVLVMLMGILISGVTIGLVSYLGVKHAAITTSIAILPFFVAGYVATGRFLQIERRVPDGISVIGIAMRAFIYIISAILLVLLCVTPMFYFTGNMGKYKEVFGGFSVTISLLGILTLLSIYLNFGVISRLRLAK